MGMRNPELPENRRLSLNYTPPAGPVEPVEASFSQLPTAAIYVRVSSSGQEDGTSLEVQMEKCRALLESEGHRTGEEFIYREVWTGADKERPELARLMAGTSRKGEGGLRVPHRPVVEGPASLATAL